MGARNCCYCGKELTDAVSIDAGIGPVCRKMENHVLAALIPAELGLARFAAARVTGLPEETLPTFAKVTAALEVETNKDWRETCKRVEWILSFAVSYTAKEALISVVEALGYVSLASLLNGEAAVGKATITCEGGRLYVKGPRNKSGRLALKTIKGWKFHPETKLWSVPATAHEAFKVAIWKHWPHNEGLAEALEAAATAPVVETPVAKPLPKVNVVLSGSVLKIASPYNGAFVAELKALITAWKDRRWVPTEKVWEVAASHSALVKTLVAKHYGETLAL